MRERASAAAAANEGVPPAEGRRRPGDGSVYQRRRVATWLLLSGLCAHAFFVAVSIAGMQIALGVAAAGLLLFWKRPARTPLDWPLLTFVSVAIASDLLSPFGPPPLAFATLWRAAIGFWIVSQSLRLVDVRAPGWLLACVSSGLALASVIGLIQYRTGFDLVHALHLRGQSSFVDAPGVPGRFGAMGFFTSRLTFGHNATLLLALLAGALAGGAVPRRQRLPTVVALVLGFAAVLATFDRAGWLALCAAALVIFTFARARRALLPLLLCVALVAAALPGVRSRFRSSFDASKNADRAFLWQRAGEIIGDHPFLGIGFANYPRVCPAYYDRVDPSFPMRTWAHNSALDLIAEMGPLGFLAALWVVAAATRALWRQRSPLFMGGMAAGMALLVIAQAHDVLYDTKVMYALWLALALGLAVHPGRGASLAGSATPRGGGATKP